MKECGTFDEKFSKSWYKKVTKKTLEGLLL